MCSRGKRAQRSHSMQPSRAHRSRPFLVDTQDIVISVDLGYKPVIEDGHNAVPNPYSREGMAQQAPMTDNTPMYKDANIERLYSQLKADVDDSETQGVKDPYSGTTGATQGKQFEDPTTRVLSDKEIRTISK